MKIISLSLQLKTKDSTCWKFTVEHLNFAWCFMWSTHALYAEIEMHLFETAWNVNSPAWHESLTQLVFVKCLTGYERGAGFEVFRNMFGLSGDLSCAAPPAEECVVVYLYCPLLFKEGYL